MRYLLIYIMTTLVVPPTNAQNSKPAFYTTHLLTLPTALQNQVCISGMAYKNGRLLLASERCPLLFWLDTSAKLLGQANTPLMEVFEIEGTTLLGELILMVSENLPQVYSLDATGKLSLITCTPPLPNKLKTGDGMEGIAANEIDSLIYLLRERNENGSNAQLFTYKMLAKDGSFYLELQNTIALPLINKDWRYADICFDAKQRRLMCLKSFSKEKLRTHQIDALAIDNSGRPISSSLYTEVPEGFANFTGYNKKEKNSLNFEGLAMDELGNLYVISDNTSGQANCNELASEKTVLLKLLKN